MKNASHATIAAPRLSVLRVLVAAACLSLLLAPAAGAAINAQLVDGLLIITDKPAGTLEIEQIGGNLVVKDLAVFQQFAAAAVVRIQIELEAALNTVIIRPENLDADVLIRPDNEDDDAYDVTFEGGVLAGSVTFEGSRKADIFRILGTFIQGDLEAQTGNGADVTIIEGDLGTGGGVVNLDTDDGPDQIFIGQDREIQIRNPIDIKQGQGPDQLAIGAAGAVFGARWTSSSGSDDDRLEFFEDAEFVQGVKVLTGSGDDLLIFGGRAKNGSFAMGPGADAADVTATARFDKNLEVTQEGDPDYLGMSGTVEGNLTVKQGEGEQDRVELTAASLVRGNVNIKNGGKNGGKVVVSEGRVEKKFNFTGGNGDDNVFLGGFVGNDVKANFGSGDDLLVLQALVVGKVKSNGQKGVDSCDLDGGVAAAVDLKNFEDEGDCVI